MRRRLTLLLTLSSFVVVTARPADARAQGERAVRLAVDATGAPRKLFRATETIPAEPGPLTLYYPAWIPGEHGPTGPFVNLSGLKFTAAGQTLRWRRDRRRAPASPGRAPPHTLMRRRRQSPAAAGCERGGMKGEGASAGGRPFV